jgi:spore coat protein A
VLNRRDFIKTALLTTGLLTVNKEVLYSQSVPDSKEYLEPFVDPLQIPKLARSINNNFELDMQECYHTFHSYYSKSKAWGFNGSYLGPTLEVKANEEISVIWQNKLHQQHLFSIDHRIHGAGKDVPDVRSVIHVHGAKTYDIYDGYPENWLLPGDKVLYKYPNEQEPATLWYHDHAIGITRLNIYAGLAGFYLIKDDARDQKFGFPTGKKDIPLLIQDKQFDNFGQIIYPGTFEPEFYGDYNVVNGKIWPFYEVEPTLYRFRLLNASNARFYNLSLGGLPFYQIATEQGLLQNYTTLKHLLLAPAERVEVVVDFSKLEGEHIKLINDAAAPYPDGEKPAKNFSQVMQFKVKKGKAKKSIMLSSENIGNVDDLIKTDVKITRSFTLNNKIDEVTKLEMHLIDNKMWDDPDVVQVKLNDVESWRFINLTEDSHPMHLHLVKFIIMERRPFDVEHYEKTKEIKFTGPTKLPEEYEKGFKDMVVANPGEVTTIKVKFEGYRGRFVWHCHMLEHEDFEMMLPYDVV